MVLSLDPIHFFQHLTGHFNFVPPGACHLSVLTLETPLAGLDQNVALGHFVTTAYNESRAGCLSCLWVSSPYTAGTYQNQYVYKGFKPG